MSTNAESDVQRSRCSGRLKDLLEVMSFELPVESVGTVTGMQSWRQRFQILGDATREATST